jgi:hypothetical protein
MGYADYFGNVKAVDGTFTRLVVLFLLTVGLVPFTTALISINRSGRIAAIGRLEQSTDEQTRCLECATNRMNVVRLARRREWITANLPCDPGCKHEE